MKYRILVFGLFLLGGHVRGQADLTLSDAIQRGLDNNYGIRIAANAVSVAENNDNDALTGKYPTVTLGLAPGVSYRNNTNPASIVSSSSTTSYSVAPSANANWTIFNGGRIALSKEQFATLTELEKGRLRLEVENTVQDIIQAYYNARVQQEQIGVRRRVINLSKDQIDYQDLRQEFGQGGTFDMLQARDAYLNDSISLEIQKTTYRTALRNLLQLTGDEALDPGTVNLTTALGDTPATYDRATLINRFEAANQNLKNLQVNRDLARLNTRLIETERQPTVGIGAGLSYDITVQTGTQTFDFGGDQPPREQSLPGIAARTLAGNLGVTANYLLFDGGARNVRIQTAKLQEITAQLDYQSTQQQFRSVLLNTLDLYENQLDVIALTRRLIENAERNITVAEERLRGGTINSFDYRAIQLAYVNAEFQLLQAQLNLKNTETELLRLTGQIVE